MLGSPCTSLNCFSPVSLSYVDLIIRPAEAQRREEGESFPLLQDYDCYAL